MRNRFYNTCLIAVSFFALSAPLQARAATDLYGNITTDTTWNLAGSPYVLHNDVAVNSGVTLTIEPGVTVKPADDADGSGGLHGSLVEFTVNGTLHADASSGTKITFTSGESTQAQGDWYGVVFSDTSTGSVLENVEIAFSYYGLRVDNVDTADLGTDSLLIRDFSTYGVYLNGSTCTVSIDNSEIHDTGDGSDDCIYHNSTGDTTHAGLELHHCSTGLYVHNSDVTVQDSLIRHCTSEGVWVQKSTSTSRYFTLNNSTLYANGYYGFYLYDTYSSGAIYLDVVDSLIFGHDSHAFYGGYSSSSYYPSVDYTYSDIWDNSINNSWMYVGATTGSFSENPLLVDPAGLDFRPTQRSPLRKSAEAGGTIGFLIYPYDFDVLELHIPTPGIQGYYWEDTTLSTGAYVVEGDITVPTGSTLTIPAGATLQFASTDDMMGGLQPSNCELRVQGALVAEGTEGSPIVLSSEAASGKTDWYGVHVYTGAEGLTMSETTIKHANRGLWLDSTDLAPADLEAQSCTNGVYVYEGNPPLADLEVHGCTTGLYLDRTQADVDGFTAYDNASHGAYVRNNTSSSRSNSFLNCLVYDNAVGFHVSKTSSGTQTLGIDHCTIAYNTGDAFYMYDNYSSSAIYLNVSTSSITDNAGHAFYGGYSSSSYYPIVSWTLSDVWNNASGVKNSWVSGSAGTGSFVYNPLYKDGGNRDFTPTQRSPLRHSDGSDGTIGYVPYPKDVDDGEDHIPTPGYMGFYWENYQFATGTYEVMGDIVITGRKIPGSGSDPVDPDDDEPAKITVIPGVTLNMKKGDDMGGGNSASKVELVNHGILEMDGISILPVKVMSNEDTPAAGDWYGVIVPADAYATNVSEVEITHADFGVRVEGSDHIIKNIEAHVCNTGVYIEGGSPEANSLVLHDNQYGLRLRNTAATVEDLIAYDNSSDGLLIENSNSTTRTNPVDGCMLYSNDRYGANLGKSSSGTMNVSFDKCTIHGNANHGIYTYDSQSSGSINVNLTNSALVSNGGYGVYGGYSSSSYYPSVNLSYTDVWDNASGDKNSWVNWYEGTETFSYNPLFKDPDNADFTPTDRSPLRCAHQDGIDAAGYRPYVGDPTGQLVGYLHGNMTLTAAGSPYTIPGDLIVDNKCDNQVDGTYTNTDGPIVMSDEDMVTSTITIADNGHMNEVDVEVHVTHADTSELVVTLTGPDGTEVVLHNHGSGADINTTYDAQTAPASGSMSSFLDNGDDMQGTWTLTIEDDNNGMGSGESGTLVSWSVKPKYRSFVILSIESGAVLNFADKADLMKGGKGTTRTELRVVDGLVIDGSTAQAQLVSGAAEPAKGDWTGVVLDTGSTVDAEGFLVEWHQYGIQGISTEDNTYSNCVIRNGSSWGINFTGGKSGTIEDCLIHKNNSGGVYMTDLTGSPLIQRNIVLDNGSYSVRVVDVSVDVVNNVLMGGATGFHGSRTGSTSHTFDLWNNTIHEFSGDCIYTNDSYSSGSLTIKAKNNLLTYCDGYAMNDAGSYDIYYSGNWDYNNYFETNGLNGISAGTHDTQWNPRYEDIDPSGLRRWYDLRLLNDSPMIDAGTSSGALIPTHDLLLVERPKLSGIDIGAYEYDPPPVNHDPWADAGEDQLVPMWDDIHQDVACFDASGTTDPDPTGDTMTYEWDFGDGEQATGKVVCHAFTSNTVHEVILTVTDNHGGIDHDVVMVDVNRRPIADAGPEVYSAAGGDAAEFDGTNSHDVDGSVVSYEWDFGDGTGTGVTTDPAPTHQYPPGPTQDFLVTLTVTDNDGHTNTDTTIAHVIGADDTVGPLISHTPVGNGQPEGVAVVITATISDYSGVASADLLYRKTGATSWTTTALTNIGGTTYQATIPAGTVTPDGVDYYIQATDGYSSPNTSTDPETAPAAFHQFTVNPVDSTGPAIVHTPVSNGQPEGEAVTINANVTDPSGVASVTLYYKVATGSTWDSKPMSHLGSGDYTADIPGVVVTSAGVDYYIQAVDLAPSGNTSTDPAGAPVTPHNFSVNVSDLTGPTITHTPIPDGQTEGVAVPVSATITDTSDIQYARLHYRNVGDSVFASVPMSAAGDTYSATIPAGIINTAGVEYYIYAQDNSAAHNASVHPDTAPSTPHSFTVTSTDTSGPSIAHTPIANGQDEGEDVAIAATVVDTSGVASVTLYYRLFGDTTWTVQAMSQGTGDEWNGVIPGAAVNLPGVEYYIKAIDASGASNESKAPAGAPDSPYQFTVREDDVTGPDVTHTPIDDGQIAGQDVVVTATVTDDSGINSVTLYYRPSGGSFTTLPMTLVSADSYGATMPGASVSEPSMDYYIRAIDDSPLNNQTAVPGSAPGTPYGFTVTPADGAGPTITHTAVEDGQAVDDDVPVSAHVTDASGLNSVTLYYRTSGEVTWDSVAMTPSVGDNFLGEIPGATAQEPGVDYYIHAIDSSPAANESAHPATAPGTPHSFTVVPPDTTGPVVTHTPITDGQPSGASVAILADVTDDSGLTGVVSVTLFYKPSNEGTFSAVVMAVTTGNTWQGTIPGFAVTEAGVDYFIEATDTSSNTTNDPISAPTTPHSFTVLPTDTTPPAINHTPVADGQAAGVPVGISALATDASDVASVTLHYRVTGDASFASTAMTDGDGDDNWDGIIPGNTVTAAGVDYYITATDASTAANTATVPATAPGTPYQFTVVEQDTIPPVITHNPVANGQPVGQDVDIQATVTDSSGLGSVMLHYRPIGSIWSSTSLNNDGGDSYSGVIPGFAVTTSGVQYYIEATDGADPANTAFAPVTAPGVSYSFTATTVDTSGPSIAHMPVSDGQEAGQDVEVSAAVSDPSGVASVVLYYRITGESTFTALPMIAAGGNLYVEEIPGFDVTGAGVDYYIEATDSSALANESVDPNGAPTLFHQFTAVVPDETPPEVTHTPVADGQPTGVDVAIQAVVTDESAVTSVTLYYRPIGSFWSTVTLTHQGAGTYAGFIPGYAVTTDGIEYYLEAVDGADPANTAYAPVTAPGTPYTFTATQADASGPSITHVPVPDDQEVGQDVAITATITDSSGVASANLHYRVAGAIDFTSISMTASGNQYSATIPGASVTTDGVDYYIEAKDQAADPNSSVEPAGAPGTTHHFTASVPDTTPPTIAHTPIADGQPKGEDVLVEAHVEDVSGVGTVTLFFRVNGSIWTSTPLTAQGGGDYAGFIPGYAVTTAGVQYYVEAEDQTAVPNVAYAPQTAPGTPYSFTVSDVDEDGPVIVHTPVGDGQLLGSPVTVPATITDPSGIASATLNYRVAGTVGFSQVAMTNTDGDAWNAAIPGAAVTLDGVDYYIEAMDQAAGANSSVEPVGAPGTTHHFTVVTNDTQGPVIIHTEVADSQKAGVAIALEATVIDPSGVSAVTLHARPEGETLFTPVPFTNSQADTWEAAIPAFLVVLPGVEYYIEAEDGAVPSNTSLAPAGGSSAPYDFTVTAPDDDGPDIQHTPIADDQLAGTAVTISATITDAAGVASASLYFRKAGDAGFSVDSMTAQGGNLWTGSIPAYSVTSDGVDYYIEATDASDQSNQSTHPSDAPAGFHYFTVVTIDEEGPQITHTPIDDGQPAGLMITVSAVVTDASGVDEVILSYRPQTRADWTDLVMAAEEDVYSVDIPGDEILVPGIEYYITATDLAVTANESLEPSEGETSPHSFTVTEEDDTAGPTLTVTPVVDGQPFGQEVEVKAKATDSSGVDSVTVFYRASGDTEFATVAANSLPDDNYVGVIPGDVVTAEIEYYVEAIDGSVNANQTVWPQTAPDTPASFDVAPPPDLEGPSLDVTVVTDGQMEGSIVSVDAVAVDESGIAGVVLHYRSTGAGDFFTSNMAAGEGADTYTAEIPADVVVPPSVEYYVTATDGSDASNTTTMPDGAPDSPYVFTVTPVVIQDTDGPVITHTPPSGDLTAGQPVLIGAIITDPSGIDFARLHYQAADAAWVMVAMTVDAGGETFSATIPGEDVVEGDLRYYIEARDASFVGNVSRHPQGGETDPVVLTVIVDTDNGGTDGGGCASTASRGTTFPTILLLLLFATVAMRRRRTV